MRALERNADEGDLSASARLLRQRIRLGELSEGAALILARLGDPCAAQVVGCASERIAEVWPALVGLDPALGLRALCAGGSAGLPYLERWLPLEEGPRLALAMAEAWLKAPSQERIRAAGDLAQRARAAVDQVNAQALGRYRMGMISGAELRALEYTAWTARDAGIGVLEVASGEAPAGDSLFQLERLFADAGWGDLRGAVRAGIAPFLA